ncbi:sugar transporter SWEET1-like [Dysidea avara]|uniref:sugar transporter SWEET1-like n=1 Tax=Dysidea avara TaxID=196820 RepID=UPI003332FBBC
MDEVQFISLVSLLAIVFTVAMFSSGIYTCHKIHVSKSTGVIPHLPFVSGILNCALWLAYGSFKDDGTVMTVNFIGLVLYLCYIVVYFVYTTNKSEVKMHTGVAFLVIMAVIVYSNYFINDNDAVLFRLGLLCNFFTVLFFASPLSTMAEVFKTKSTESMSFPLSILSLFVTFLWVIYSYLVDDVFIKIPNFLGLLLALVQLMLFAMYWNKKRKLITLELPVVQ